MNATRSDVVDVAISAPAHGLDNERGSLHSTLLSASEAPVPDL